MVVTHPEFVLVVVGIVELDDVGVAEFVKNINLHSEISQFFVTLNGTDLGSCVSSIISVSSLVNLTKGSITQFSNNLPELIGIHALLDVREVSPLLAVALPDVEHLLDAAKKRHLVTGVWVLAQ